MKKWSFYQEAQIPRAAKTSEVSNVYRLAGVRTAGFCEALVFIFASLTFHTRGVVLYMGGKVPPWQVGFRFGNMLKLAHAKKIHPGNDNYYCNSYTYKSHDFHLPSNVMDKHLCFI